ncbi:hypothetical protein F511_20311 [Dorcoceras hygrometricum]|uniref:CCHC-type domain-containing protein n=1 Tax=Dorcoceras hygrometricum TaxID=472368 RepID=A0A2Z7B3V3_9LAMI|nr:hypothetical protein F511_20311 [Dorcoceras hygrometricum]
MQCVGVQGSCNLCGQYGHFVRVCPSVGSQQTAAQAQGRGGQSMGRSHPFQQPRMVEEYVNAGLHSCSARRKRRRLDVAVGCPAARELCATVACDWWCATVACSWYCARAIDQI